MHQFKKLNVYQRALKLTKVVRQITHNFPKNEIFGLSAQFKRAADSIVLNIAEGAGNVSKKEFARFLSFSIRSAYECEGCLDIALQNEFINTKTHEKLTTECSEIAAMLDGLSKSLSR